MKNYMIFIFVILMSSCSSDDSKPLDENGIIGKWTLIEQLTDPGDGSGEFAPTNSNRTIQFFSNGTVSINGILCYMSSEVGEGNTGFFYESTEDNDFFDCEILPNNCEYRETKVYYNLEDNNLILWYQCIEGCGQKFKKI